MAASTTPGLGGITQVEDFENSLQIEALTRFAVDEYNKKQNALVLEFKKVLDAKQQVVAGFMYYLTLEVFDRVEKKKKVCETQVGLKLDNTKELLEFKFVDDSK